MSQFYSLASASAFPSSPTSMPVSLWTSARRHFFSRSTPTPTTTFVFLSTSVPCHLSSNTRQNHQSQHHRFLHLHFQLHFHSLFIASPHPHSYSTPHFLPHPSQTEIILFPNFTLLPVLTSLLNLTEWKPRSTTR